MEYTKPVVLAQNSKEQSFAAGCPANDGSHSGPVSPTPDGYCRRCEVTK